MLPVPFPQSYWFAEGRLLAGHYPGDLDPASRAAKLQELLDCGIRRVVNLMEEHETGNTGKLFEAYYPRLLELAMGEPFDFVRVSVRDASAAPRRTMSLILDILDNSIRQGVPAYLHCWGGHGRTSTVVACFLVRHGDAPEQAIARVLAWRASLPKKHYPFERQQEALVRSWKAGE